MENPSQAALRLLLLLGLQSHCLGLGRRRDAHQPASLSASQRTVPPPGVGNTGWFEQGRLPLHQSLPEGSFIA